MRWSCTVHKWSALYPDNQTSFHSPPLISEMISQQSLVFSDLLIYIKNIFCFFSMWWQRMLLQEPCRWGDRSSTRVRIRAEALFEIRRSRREFWKLIFWSSGQPVIMPTIKIYPPTQLPDRDVTETQFNIWQEELEIYLMQEKYFAFFI